MSRPLSGRKYCSTSAWNDFLSVHLSSSSNSHALLGEFTVEPYGEGEGEGKTETEGEGEGEGEGDDQTE